MRTRFFFGLVGATLALDIPKAPEAGLVETDSDSDSDLNTKYEFIAQPKHTDIKMVKESWELEIPELGVKPIPAKLRDWPKLTMFTGTDKLSQNIQKNGYFEGDWVQLLIQEWKDNGSVGNFLDVGGNMGAFTLPLAAELRNVPDATVVSVEALPLNRHLLRLSIKKNRLDNVHLYEYAVGNETADKWTKMMKGGGNSGHAAIAPHHGKIVVPLTTLDAILNQDKAMENVFGMKLDVEGFEVPALDGARKFMTQYTPCVVVAEMNRSPKDNEGLRAHIEAHGFEQVHHKWSRNKIFKQKDMKSCLKQKF